MKNINIASLLLCFFLLFSCGEDNEFSIDETVTETVTNEVSKDDIDYKDYDEDDCGYIDELCLKCPVVEQLPIGPTLGFKSEDDDEFTRNQVDNDLLYFDVDGHVYEVRGANFFKGSREFIISVDGRNYATSDSDDPFLNEHVLDVDLPEILDVINLISFDDLIDGKLNADDLRGFVGDRSNVVTDAQGNVRVNVGTTDGSTASLRIYDPCRGVNMVNLTKKYVEILNMGGIHSSAESIIEEALLDCLPPDFDPKKECVNTGCVVANVLDNPLIANSQTSPFEVKLNYLAALLDLTENEYMQFSYFDASDRFFIDDLFDALTDDSGFEGCENADCSIKPGVQTLLDAYLSDEYSIQQSDIESTLDYYSSLYCENKALVNKAARLGPCASGSIYNLIEQDFDYNIITNIIEKYAVAWDVYYGTAYEIGGLKDELLEKDVTWCDMIEITNVMYADEYGLPTLMPGLETEYQKSVVFNPVYLALKATGEAFTDAAIQSLFIWISDNDKDSFQDAFQCVDVIDVAFAFLEGLLPGGGQTKKAAKAAAIAAIVVMDRAIDEENYTWEEAGKDFTLSFFEYYIEQIFGDAFVKYGKLLAKGAVKKFDPYINPNGFLGITFKYKTIVKWFGGKYVNGNYKNIPVCENCFFNMITGEYEDIVIKQAIEGWEDVTEIYIVGAVQNRVLQFKDFLKTQNLPFDIKTINDTIDGTDWTYDLNVEWVRDLKKEGRTIVDIGAITDQLPTPPYQMELDEIFN